MFTFMTKIGLTTVRKNTTRLIALLLAVVLLCGFMAPRDPDHTDYGNAQVNVNSANIRNAAGTVNTSVIAVLNKGARVTACEVVELSSDPSGKLIWCKIVFEYQGSQLTGYIVDSFLTKDDGAPVDQEFENEIAGFPESYKTQLRILHANHPTWHFKMLSIDHDFTETVNLESSIGVSLITNSANDAWKSVEPNAYDWLTDKFIVYDGQSWVNAARQVVEYYLDPRNMLNEQYVFQFADLSYYPDSQPIDSVQCILNGTFMQSGTITNMKGEQVTYAQTFVRAAELSGANPVFLASKCIQEVSPSGSGSTSGNYGNLAGYYNYYNIGAYSSADPVAKGLQFARDGSADSNLNSKILIPWTSPYRAVCGGGIFIASQYIAVGQDSIYLMKFNVHPATASQYGKHQYMTNIQGAISESKKMFTAYQKAGILETSITFTIPVYQNMPETPASLPAQTGNPNNCLSSLMVDGYLLTPQFDPLNCNEYSLVVPPEVTSVNVVASAVSTKASVSGGGTVSLADGVNRITISVKAQNGNVREYYINVARDMDSPGNFFSVPLVSTGSYYSGIEPDTTVEQLLALFTLHEGYGITYLNMNAEAKAPTDKIATGDLFCITDPTGAVVYTGTILLRGDANGDGNISAADLTLITHVILGESSLSAAGNMAADANKDGKVTAADLTVIVHHILQSGRIVQ